MSNRTAFQAGALIAATPLFASAQTGSPDPGTIGPAWSPYLVGALIGVLSMFTFYLSDKPLGASTAYARIAGLLGRLFARGHTDSLHYYAEKKMPKIGWEVTLVGGIVIGGFLAAWNGGEITGRWLPPMWVERFGESVWLRLGLGFLGLRRRSDHRDASVLSVRAGSERTFESRLVASREAPWPARTKR